MPKLVRLAHGGSHSDDGEPRVHGDVSAHGGAAHLQGAVLEASHHQRGHKVAVLLGHLGGHRQKHQHVVALSPTHRVQFHQHIQTRNFYLDAQMPPSNTLNSYLSLSTSLYFPSCSSGDKFRSDYFYISLHKLVLQSCQVLEQLVRPLHGGQPEVCSSLVVELAGHDETGQVGHDPASVEAQPGDDQPVVFDLSLTKFSNLQSRSHYILWISLNSLNLLKYLNHF